MKNLALGIQTILLSIAISILTALLWEPWVEGVNANATMLREIYFDDPFLAYIYFAFIPVFVGLYKGFKLAGNFGRGEMYSRSSMEALRAIKYCAFAFAGYIFLAVVYIFITMRGKDDIAGGVAMGFFMIVTSAIVATVSARFERNILKHV
jgi:hypothetical protein